MSYTRGKLYFSDKSAQQNADARNTTLAELPKLGIAYATIYDTWGVCDGQTEFGFVLETLSLEPVSKVSEGVSFTLMTSRLEELAEYLRHEFQQTSVLITIDHVDGKAILVQELN